MHRRVVLFSALLSFGCIAWAQQPSLGDAARELRKNKPAGKAAVEFTNDNLPTDGTINVVGQPVAPKSEGPSVTPASRNPRLMYQQDPWLGRSKKLSDDMTAEPSAQDEQFMKEGKETLERMKSQKPFVIPKTDDSGRQERLKSLKPLLDQFKVEPKPKPKE